MAVNDAVIQQGFEVEWLAILKKHENGDTDFEGSQYQIQDFNTRNEAMEFARQIVMSAPLAYAQVREFKLDAHDYKDYLGELEEVTPED